MSHGMKRWIPLLVIAAACSPTRRSAPPPTSSPIDPVEQKRELTAAYRKLFSNPGGMWTPAQMKLPGHQQVFEKMGVELTAEQLSDPLRAPLAAVVSLGGCTASFVSPEGLVVTNHHCVQGALQHNSSAGENLVEKGFLAKTRAEEKSAGPAQRIYVAQAFTDVTVKMREGLEKITDGVQRKDELERREKALVAECEKDRPGLRCQVSSFFRGEQYTLIENLEIRDVRLVYVPARSVGNYGGEIDNWAWPRHTGDFSFYRAYVGKDGKPADFSPDNVPFAPKHFLRVSKQGTQAGDFVMVTGYPGVTNRTSTAAETRHNVDWFYPYYIAYLKQRYALVEGFLTAKGDTAIKAGVQKQSIQNGLEKTEGILKGLTGRELLQRKDKLDADVRAWAAQPGHAQHQAAIARLDQLVADRLRSARADFDRNNAFGAARALGTALQLVRWADERTKPNAERKPGYQDRDMARALAGQKQFGKQYDRAIDQATMKLVLLRALELPAAEREWLPVLLGAKGKTKIDEALIEKTVAGWYAKNLIEDERVRLELLQSGTLAQCKASKDPFIQAALRVWPTVKAEEKKQDARTGDVLLVAPAYADAMRQVLGGQLAPDANSTLRITYGTVRSFKPTSKSVADRAYTTASQIPAKNTGKAPFDAPAGLLEAIAAKRYGGYADRALGGELPVDFLSDLDITGGNSGSPALNGKGELVGLAFDGTIEGVASDVVFDGATTRTIQVDARYMLWVMDAIDGADHLITEMGHTPEL